MVTLPVLPPVQTYLRSLHRALPSRRRVYSLRTDELSVLVYLEDYHLIQERATEISPSPSPA